MAQFDVYVLVLCLIVFVLLVSLSTVALTTIIKLTLKLIRSGAEDDKIREEFERETKPNKFTKIFETAISGLFCLVFGAIFVGATYINCTQNVYFENVPTYRVVQTGSMAKKYEDNTYLFENGLDNQIQAFDLIMTYKIPKEEELKLYDVVVYEVDDLLIIHRIVGIEEANDRHPNERYFLLQGDAVSSPDRFPVLYSQMRGIYRGERIPFIGSFILFMQSPAGWLCIMLVLASIIITPILEKKLLNARRARFLLITASNEEVVTEDIIPLGDTQNPFSLFNIKRNNISFIEKLNNSTDIVKNRYETVMGTVRRIAEARVIEGKKQHTYKSGNLPIVRLNFRGKTLNAYLGLDPSEYVDSKYIYTDVSNVKTHANYPMRVKLSSDRQAKWTCELITELCAKNGIVLLEKPQEIQVEQETVNPFAHLKGKRDIRTFKERLESSNEKVKARYDTVTGLLRRVDGVRVIDARKTETFKKGNTPITKLTIKGKTLNTYLGLNPKEYENSKYIYTDESNVKVHKNYPMRVKLSSDRQARWVNELITELCAKNGLTLLEKPQEFEDILQVENQVVSPFAHLVGRETKTFKERLDNSNENVKERYQIITELLSRIEGVRVIDSKKSETFKKGNTPIIKLTIKGKTLNAYISLQPSDYFDTKYIFTDVSNVKSHKNYPMRVKVTSDRQARWVNELITDVANKNSFTVLEKPVIKVAKEFSFADLKKKKARGFRYRLRLSPIAKERYDEIKKTLSRIDGIRRIDAKTSVTYKLKSKPIVKFTIRGKTLNAYIGLNPKDYEDTKYIFTDVSSVKAYANYPMRVKVTSDRQVRWVKELLGIVVENSLETRSNYED